jgi:tetratricopeptide (TPR) repeat protein
MKKTILYLSLLIVGITISYSQQTNPYLTKLNTALISDDYSKALVLCDSLVMSDSLQLAQSNYYKALIYKSIFRYSDALNHINRSIAIDTTNVDYQMELGRILYQRGKLSLADSVFANVFELDSTNLSAGIYLSRIKIKTENFEEALDVYLRLTALDSMNSYFNKQVGFCLSKQRNQTNRFHT